MKNIKWLRSLALLMTVVLLVSAGFFAKGNALKAEEDDRAYVAEEAAPEEVVTEIVIDTSEPAPAEEAEPAEEASESEEKAEDADADKEEEKEDAKEAEDEFNVVEAYAHYMSLDEDGKAEYLASLSPENREMLLQYIKAMEEKAKEAEKKEEVPEEASEPEETEDKKETEQMEKKISTWYEYEGKPAVGTVVTIKSELTGYADGTTYQWQRSLDGINWENAPNGNGPTYVFTLDRENCAYTWRLHVEEPQAAAA